MRGLKRRPRPQATETQTLGTEIGETLEEPPLKKFKALFESTNPKGDLDPNFDEIQSGGDSHSQSQTQSETQPRSERPLRSMGASSLAVLREEEEETQTTTTTHQRGSKRRLETLEEDEEMQVDHPNPPSTSEAAPRSKKRAIEDVNSVRRTNEEGVLAPNVGATNKPPSTVKPPSTARASGKQGAPTGKPDTDAAFLKAIASTKRGKKTEDDFDREFNKLKIAKPVLERHDPEEEWAVLKDFGDDSNIRGNFMTIVDLDVFRKPNAPKSSTSMNPAWVGLPNFKKFKQVRFLFFFFSSLLYRPDPFLFSRKPLVYLGQKLSLSSAKAMIMGWDQVCCSSDSSYG